MRAEGSDPDVPVSELLFELPIQEMLYELPIGSKPDNPENTALPPESPEAALVLLKPSS